MPKGKKKRTKLSYVSQGLIRKVLTRKDVGKYTVVLIQETYDGVLEEKPFIITAVARDLKPNEFKNPFVKRVDHKPQAFKDFNLMVETIEELNVIERT